MQPTEKLITGERTQMITEPKIEHRNAQPYMGIRAQVTMQELGKVLPPLWGEVYGWLASKGLKPIGAPLWRYRVIDMAAKLEIDVAVPVAGAAITELAFKQAEDQRAS